MREFAGFAPYSDPRPFNGRVSVEMERQFANVNNWSNGVKEYDPTGRIRVVIEGEAELVNALLGKNFLKRKARVYKRLGGRRDG